MTLKHSLRIFLFFVIVLSCSKKQAPFQPAGPLGIANKWVYDSMKLYYYWSDQINSHPDYSLPTADFFKQLLSPEDRFSFISDRSNTGVHRTSAELYGFQYAFINHPFDAQKLVGIVTLVVPNSDAASRVHLQRGMFFTKVNDREITSENMPTVIADLSSTTNAAAMLQLAALDNNGVSLNDSARVAVQRATVAQKSVYGAKVFQYNNIRTGYLAYYLCYEKEDGILLQKMQAFKNAGISEMILDLRYNPGGSVASATKLAAMLVSSFNPDSKFITYTGNRHGGTVRLSFKEAIQFSGNANGKDMNALQSVNTGLKRIFVLTSRATASAAELLCNNLKPYVQVKLIGETTFGKDEASFTIEDTRSPRQVDWILTPIVYKVADANGHGGYSSGIVPDYAVNEFERLPLAELGMPGDVLVDKALELVYGTSQVGGSNVRVGGFLFPAVRALYYSSQSGVFTMAAPGK